MKTSIQIAVPALRNSSAWPPIIEATATYIGLRTKR